MAGFDFQPDDLVQVPYLKWSWEVRETEAGSHGEKRQPTGCCKFQVRLSKR